jgi:hypothetical protein
MNYYLLMDSNCSIPECDAAPIAICLKPFDNVGGGQWVESGSIDYLRTKLLYEHPYSVIEFNALALQVFETINVKNWSVDVFVVKDGTWSSYCKDDFSGMLSVSNCTTKKELIDFLFNVPGF